MKSDMQDRIRTGVLSGLTILSGSTGILVAVGVLRIDGPTTLRYQAIVAMALYVTGAASGALLLFGGRNSHRLVRFYWFLQVPVINGPFVGYQFSGGAAIYAIFSAIPFEFQSSVFVGANFYFVASGSEAALQIGCNMVPLMVLLLLRTKLNTTASP
jgi:hypothetical protein